ncbi:MAG: DUF1585 domain-containing protein [Nannocystales bacterium]
MNTLDTRGFGAARARRFGPPMALLALTWLAASPAEARPSGPALLCETYPSSPDCLGRLPTCETCHPSTDPPQWNAYGGALLGALDGADFDTGLADALAAVEGADADGDGASNLDEILVGTQPGNAESLWSPVPVDEDSENPWYRVGDYDVRLAYRRAMVLYCGSSPTYEALNQIGELDGEAQRARLHEDLAACLDGAYWRTTGLRQLADTKVKPIYSVGPETQVYFDGFRIVLADYNWDYRLWRYLLSDDRDIRELLTAQYHVLEDVDGTLSPVEGAIPNTYEDDAVAGGQPLEPEQRAGMLTTQWFLMSNTMFSALPRTTAAQAYRAYLGMDLSNNEGIVPVAGEPLDVDDKGVAEPACAQCHSTLDPLAYAFSYYHGIEFPFDIGLYDENRPSNWIEHWDPEAQRSQLLGVPVNSVVEWGQVASQSEYFRAAMTQTLFEHALGRAAIGPEREVMVSLAETLPSDGHSANRLIHRIVDTSLFGEP